MGKYANKFVCKCEFMECHIIQFFPIHFSFVPVNNNLNELRYSINELKQEKLITVNFIIIICKYANNLVIKHSCLECMPPILIFLMCLLLSTYYYWFFIHIIVKSLIVFVFIEIRIDEKHKVINHILNANTVLSYMRISTCINSRS